MFFFAYTYKVSLRYAKLINLQIALAASLKNKTVRKTVISKVASNSNRDSKRCTIYQLLAFVTFGELTTLSQSEIWMIYIEAFGDRKVVTDHNMNRWF